MYCPVLTTILTFLSRTLGLNDRAPHPASDTALTLSPSTPHFYLLISIFSVISSQYYLLISISSVLSRHFYLLISISSFLSPQFYLLISISSVLSPHLYLLSSISSSLSPHSQLSIPTQTPPSNPHTPVLTFNTSLSPPHPSPHSLFLILQFPSNLYSFLTTDTSLPKTHSNPHSPLINVQFYIQPCSEVSAILKSNTEFVWKK